MHIIIWKTVEMTKTKDERVENALIHSKQTTCFTCITDTPSTFSRLENTRSQAFIILRNASHGKDPVSLTLARIRTSLSVNGSLGLSPQKPVKIMSLVKHTNPHHISPLPSDIPLASKRSTFNIDLSLPPINSPKSDSPSPPRQHCAARRNNPSRHV